MRRGDTDHGDHKVIHGEFAANDTFRAAKTLLPRSVAQDGDGARAGNSVFVRPEKAAAGGREAQRGEVIASDDFAEDALRGAVLEPGDAANGTEAGQGGEDFVARLVIPSDRGTRARRGARMLRFGRASRPATA